MKVVFRESLASPYPIAAAGELSVSGNAITSDHIRTPLGFRIDVDYSDLPLDEVSNTGVLSANGSQDWYSFKIIHSETDSRGRRTGTLIIAQMVEGP